MRLCCTLAILGLALRLTPTPRAAANSPFSDELHPPIHVTIAGEPLDVEREGHAAPFFGDVDGDGLSDLLVGQYSEGKLRLYRNVGSNTDPRFDDYRFVLAAGAEAKVPFG